ncbi:Uncharacterised protein [Mycobacterium tuberculosis]|nr:Uncharacterised protein [Mycobacterium tuberculosis]COY70898.1 Uncharacterised protein [Mycobacterium tuberculosis]
MDIGVAGAGEGRLLTSTRQQLIAIQPVGNRLQQYNRAGEHCELNASCLGQHASAGCQPKAAEQVMRQQAR